MNELIVNTLSSIVSNFDFTFCLIVNVATYLFIKLCSDIYNKIVFSTWGKRTIFVTISIILGIVYYYIGTDVKILVNSFIIAPISWSWIFKPICAKFNIDYKHK